MVQLNLNVAFLLVARILAGLSGDFNSILASCYAYLSDVSSHEKRTLRIAIGEACTGIGGLLASIVSSVWIESQVKTNYFMMLFIVFEEIKSRL